MHTTSLLQIVARLRDGFRSHVTLDYEYRMKQLRNLKRLLEENEVRILEALKLDLNKVSDWFAASLVKLVME